MMILHDPLSHVALGGSQGSLFAQYTEIDNLADFLLGRVCSHWQPFTFQPQQARYFHPNGISFWVHSGVSDVGRGGHAFPERSVAASAGSASWKAQ